MRRVLACLVVLAFAGRMEFALASDSLVGETKAAMRKAADYFRSISTNGGYVGIYSLDLAKRYGESFYEKAKPTEIWVQPPGTPTVGQCYLRAWQVTGDKYYFDAARDVARALVWGQRRIGGWDHRVDVAHLKPEAKAPVRKEGRCTFDDNITQGALKFLIDADSAIDDHWLTDGIELGLEFMQKSQFANGAWPQWYPLRGGYHDYYTFNDNAINDCIDVMLKAHRVYGRQEYLACARRGGDFILASQLAEPQAGWAQQYGRDMKPAWARSFEPPGVCSLSTARNIRTLVQLYLYTKDEKYLAAIPAAIEWLEDSKIGPNLWARVYEVGTNRPVYGDREDGNKVHYDYDKISTKERTSYAWQGEYGLRSAVSYYRRCKTIGARRDGAKPASQQVLRQRAKKAEPSAKKAVAALDQKGRWTNGETITCESFVQNFRLLCTYLDAAQQLD